MERGFWHHAWEMIKALCSYPPALFKPRVYEGYFPHPKYGPVQEKFYAGLLALGYKRTRWQFVLPNQCAGVAKRIPPQQDGVNEHHIRFYTDGTIDCELEFDRGSTGHWTGAHRYMNTMLSDLLKKVKLTASEQAIIRKIFKRDMR